MKDIKTKRAAIYARVSTDGQTTDNQLCELHLVAERNGWPIVQEFVDQGISGAKGRDQRPAFNALWKGAIRREFDVVMVWAVDRLGRSLSHLVNFLSEIHAKKVDLFIHQQGIDTTTPAGKALFGMMGVYAEFERDHTLFIGTYMRLVYRRFNKAHWTDPAEPSLIYRGRLWEVWLEGKVLPITQCSALESL
jgi:Resolvase, N terminal domain